MYTYIGNQDMSIRKYKMDRSWRGRLKRGEGESEEEVKATRGYLTTRAIVQRSICTWTGVTISLIIGWYARASACSWFRYVVPKGRRERFSFNRNFPKRHYLIPPPFTNCISIFPIKIKNLSILCTTLYPEGDVIDSSNPHRFPISIYEDSNHQLTR